MGRKSIYHHRGTPPFSVCRPTPRSQNKIIYGVCHFPGKTREKGIHSWSGKKDIHHRGLRLEKEKRRVSTVVVSTFSSLNSLPLQNLIETSATKRMNRLANPSAFGAKNAEGETRNNCKAKQQSAFLKHAFREVTFGQFGFCKGTVLGAPLSPHHTH